MRSVAALFGMTSVLANASAAAAQTDAPTNAAIVDFPAGATSLALPVRYDDTSGKFVVRVTIGDRSLGFLLDTGSTGIVLQHDVAQSLGLVDSAATTGTVANLHVGDLAMRDVAIHTTPDLGTHEADPAIVGLLGFAFLRGVDLRLDYAAGTVTAYDPKSFAPPNDAGRIDVPVRLVAGVPETSVTINGAIGARFAIDTGSAGALIVAEAFRRLHPSAVVDARGRSNEVSVSGVGGAFTTDEIVLAEVDLGGVRFRNENAYVITSKTAFAFDEDGFIGPDFLRRFTVYVDLPRERIVLIPANATPRRPS